MSFQPGPRCLATAHIAAALPLPAMRARPLVAARCTSSWLWPMRLATSWTKVLWYSSLPLHATSSSAISALRRTLASGSSMRAAKALTALRSPKPDTSPKARTASQRIAALLCVTRGNTHSVAVASPCSASLGNTTTAAVRTSSARSSKHAAAAAIAGGWPLEATSAKAKSAARRFWAKASCKRKSTASIAAGSSLAAKRGSAWPAARWTTSSKSPKHAATAATTTGWPTWATETKALIAVWRTAPS
mmetsp:Transcript_24493/g.73556  ORF Transcript_24493/g.73556 Transcript_24493/m.73556 type:complete len:247 (+) Transcript_24493:311-1051(+)